VFGVIVAAATAGAFAQAPSASAQAPASKAITNEDRLFQRFVEDGAVTENVWFETQFRYQSFDKATVAYLEPTVAVNVAEDIELGGRIRLLTADPDGGSTETGFSDMDVYGKIRLSTKPTQTALGVLLKLPTGDEKKSPFHGTGEMDVAFFGSVRHDFHALTLVGNAGLRINQDPDFPRPPNEREGETSIQLGGAALFPLTIRVSGVIEASFETKRFNDAGSDFRVTLGANYRRNEGFSARFAGAGGNGASAPDLELIASAVFLF
jgi:hypothetical protein